MAYRDGLGQLNQQIASLRESIAVGRDNEAQLTTLGEARLGNEADLAELEDGCAKAERAVGRLERFGIVSLFFKVIGSHAKRLESRRDERNAAKDRRDAAAKSLATHLEAEEACSSLIASGTAAAVELARLRGEKEAWLAEHGGPVADELSGRIEAIRQIQGLRAEIEQATAAGRVAHEALAEVLRSLGSAKSWGTFDMLGGGLIATAVKHSKIGKARDELEVAQAAIANFQREAKEVELHLSAAVEIDSFSSFADYFFDGIFFDWAVQSKITRSQESVKDASSQVAKAIESLEHHGKEVSTRLGDAERQRAELVELWGS